MLNYFDLLELEVDFNLSDSAINRAYLDLQAKFHPDKKTGDLERSALLNQAFVELKDPLKRAKHIFELNGMEIHRSTISSALLSMMEKPEENLKLRLEELRSFFQKNELSNAYDAWCDCQYLARKVAQSRTQ